MAGTAETGIRPSGVVRRDRERREDELAELEGTAILALDPETAGDFAGAVLDIQADALGLRLFLNKQRD
jgi:hypothetical protein